MRPPSSSPLPPPALLTTGAECGEGGCRSTGIGMDGVIAVFWTDLDPGKVTDCPQTHHCGGGGNVYYKTESDRLVRARLRVGTFRAVVGV